MSEWREFSTVPKNGQYVLALMAGADGRWEYLNGRAFVIRHDGVTPSGYDMGWAVCPGFGGVDDAWFSHWHPLPTPRELTERDL